MDKEETNKPKDTEALILHAAEREFMSKGFAGARTTAIAEAAGVTHAMLHYYFRTKEKLFDRIVSEKIDVLKNALVTSVSEFDMPLDEMIRNVVEQHLEFIASNPDLPRFLIGELYGGSERSTKILEKLQTIAPVMIRLLQDKIDVAAARGECRAVDAKMLALDIASLNIFSYLATPIVNAALDNCMIDPDDFLERRKKENYETIMRKLRP